MDEGFENIRGLGTTGRMALDWIILKLQFFTPCAKIEDIPLFFEFDERSEALCFSCGTLF